MLWPRTERGQELSLDGEWMMASCRKSVFEWISTQSGVRTFWDNCPQFMERWEKESWKPEWIKVNIPASVHTCLLEAGKIPDPYYGMNAEKLWWVERKDWLFKKVFMVPSGWKGKSVRLGFDGVDYHAEFSLNGVFLGKHEGMYGGPVYDVSRHLKYGKKNELLVCIKPIFEPLQDVMKPWSCNGFWCPPLKSMGIWRSVRLAAAGACYLENPFVKVKGIKKKKASVEISVDAVNTNNRPVNAGLVAEITGKNVKAGSTEHTEKVILKPGTNRLDFRMEIADPKLWWPNGMGDQNLYNLRLSLVKRADKEPFDTISTRFGIRTIKWNGLTPSINGRKFFFKGSHFTPLDIILRNPREKYEWMLHLIKNCNINMLRLWGHGHVESDDFYDICDELGIMVWQEFPMSCAYKAKFRSREMWADQVEYSIKRLRNHPSLVAWCGGNEFHDEIEENKDLIDKLDELCSTLDGTRLFRRSSPYSPHKGPVKLADPGSDAHIWLAHARADYSWHKKYKDLAVASEFGVPISIPDMKNLRKFMPQDEIEKMDGEAFRYHWGEDYWKTMIPHVYVHVYGKPKNMEEYIRYSQVAQGMFNKYAVEFFRSNWPTSTGTFQYSFNQIWPFSAWTDVVDWYGLPMAGYYFLKRSYEPLHVSAVFPHCLWAPGKEFVATVHVVNDYEEAVKGSTVTATIMDSHFNVRAEKTKKIDIPGRCSSTRVMDVKWRIPTALRNSVFLLCVVLRDRMGEIVSKSVYCLTCTTIDRESKREKKWAASWGKVQPTPDLKDGPWVSEVEKTRTELILDCPRKVELNGEKTGKVMLTVRNAGEVPSFITEIKVSKPDCDYVCSDNYFFLLAGEEKKVDLEILFDVSAFGSPVKAKVKKLKEVEIRISSWNAAEVVKKVSVEKGIG